MDLPLGSYEDPPASSTKLVNCYIEKGGDQGRGPVLQGSPGISEFQNVGDGPIRGAHVMGNTKYVVSDNKLYSVTSGVTQLGTIPRGSRVQMADNGTQLAILVEPDLYVYTTAAGVVQVTDVDYPGASSIQFLDNYLSFTEPNEGRWWITDLADFTSVNALSFSTADGAPDDIVTHVVDHRQAVLLGKETFEIWDNAGVTGFPFIRSSNGFGEIGCLAKYSAVKADQSVFWLANDGTIRRLQGITPVRVSTDAVDKAIAGYTASECIGHTLTWMGHVWVVFTFPENTWIFDINTGQWHERNSYGYDNWRASCFISQNNVTYVGDSESNKFGVVDDVFQEWDDPLVMQFTFAPIYGKGRGAIHNRLELMFEQGVGLSVGQGSDPEVSLYVSDDGQVFRAFPTRRLGAIGEYQKRVFWNRLGLSRNRVYRGTISDPVRRKLVSAEIEAEGCSI